LTIALNRALGIKAKNISDDAIWLSRGDTWDDKDRYIDHAWVETYVDGRWVIQDPTWNPEYTIFIQVNIQIIFRPNILICLEMNLRRIIE
jgi:hypothetical protein